MWALRVRDDVTGNGNPEKPVTACLACFQHVILFLTQSRSGAPENNHTIHKQTNGRVGGPIPAVYGRNKNASREGGSRHAIAIV